MSVATHSAAAIAATLRAAGCLFPDDEAAILLAAADGDELASLVSRRVAGTPLEHLVGWADFDGIRVPAAPGVFVPRRRTAFVARVAAELAPQGGSAVDLCCGTGAIAIALATLRPDLTVVASDIDKAAVAVAARALSPLGGAAVVSNMDQSLPVLLGRRVDVMTSCPPYVPTAEVALLPAEARVHEPFAALDGGPDGTTMQRRVFAAATRLLGPAGVCIVETSEHLAEATLAAAGSVGLTGELRRDDALGAVVVVARR